MSYVPDGAKIIPEIAKMSEDTLTKLGFQLIKSDETSIIFKKEELYVKIVRPGMYDLVEIFLKYDNLVRGIACGVMLEYYFTGDYPITKSYRQQYNELKATEEYQSLKDYDQREQINFIRVISLLEIIKQLLPEIENNFDPEKYLSWSDDNWGKLIRL